MNWKRPSGHWLSLTDGTRGRTADVCWLCVTVLAVRHCVGCEKGKKAQTEFTYHIYSWIAGIKTNMVPIIWSYLQRQEHNWIFCVLYSRVDPAAAQTFLGYLEEWFGTTHCLSLWMMFHINRCLYNGVRMYFIVVVLTLQTVRWNWKTWMTTSTIYIILKETLRIKKQMWLMFPLFVLFIWYIPPFNRIHTIFVLSNLHSMINTKHSLKNFDVLLTVHYIMIGFGSNSCTSILLFN